MLAAWLFVSGRKDVAGVAPSALMKGSADMLSELLDGYFQGGHATRRGLPGTLGPPGEFGRQGCVALWHALRSMLYS